MTPNPSIELTSSGLRPLDVSSCQTLGVTESMSTSSVLLVLGITAIIAWSLAFGGRLPKAYRGRTCQGRGWRKAFPSATKQEIREFLSLFASAFAFDDHEKLKLAPTDEILKIYRAQYPTRLQPDAMELETLAGDLERKHSFKLEAMWKDSLTLGELFSHTLERRGIAK
jgi:propanediol dehydratase small subunit